MKGAGQEESGAGTEPIEGGLATAPREEVRRVVLLLAHREGLEAVSLTAGQPVVVGREAPADVRIADTTLSRAHARFTLDEAGDGLAVTDLGSMNGTWVDGQRVEQARIRGGQALKLGGVLGRVQVLRGAPEVPVHRTEGATGDIVAGPRMRALLELAARVARTRVPVVLSGETGTGKEVVARFIHENGPRRAGPMVSVNCGAVPAELVESTLFGHERGAFTGAHRPQKGVFEAADGGTLFLDEIGEMAPATQVALLRVLETGRFSRVGAVEERSCDVRLIAATHRDLAAMAAEGRFRADLYYRLATMTLELPPLRERPEDVEALARRFLRDAAAESELPVIDLGEDALRVLRAYAFPGNVRELRNVMARAVVVAEGDTVTARDLPARVREAAPEVAAEQTETETETETEEEREESEEASGPARGLKARVAEYEGQVILEALHRTGWKRPEAARMLDMPLRTLTHKIAVLGLVRTDRDAKG